MARKVIVKTFIIQSIKSDIIEKIDEFLQSTYDSIKGVYRVIPNTELIYLTISYNSASFDATVSYINNILEDSGTAFSTTIMNL